MVRKQRKITTISFDADPETYDLLQEIKKQQSIPRGFQSKMLRRLLSNAIAGWGNGHAHELEHLDDDLRIELERFNDRHKEVKRRKLELMNREQIYWTAMTEAFKISNAQAIYARHGSSIFEDLVTMIRSRTFEQSEGTLSPPVDLVRKFLYDTFEELEANGEMNKMRCEFQEREF